MFDVKLMGKRIKELRGNASQDECAEKLGISRGALSFYEQGKRTPDAEVIYRMCEYFNVSSSYLIGLSDTKTNNVTVQEICDYLGITEQTVEGLINIKIQKDCLNFKFDNILPAVCSPGISGDYYQKCIEYLIKNELGEFATDIISNYISLCEYENKAFGDGEIISSFEDAEKSREAKEKLDMLKYRNYRCCAELLERFIVFLDKNDDCVNSHKEYINNIIKNKDIFITEITEETEENKEVSNYGKHTPPKE
ncbi:MAG: helix-turn-helix transcriptional regulator [Oscillospiraceae bacterium]|nr:helix-turn-helix transcriptional regulator [Oscillospiraceae bacterium]